MLIVFLLPSLGLLGQNEDRADRMKEKMKAQRVAFITSELELTEAESQKFWPIFNSYRSEIDELKAQNVKPSKNMTDKEAEDMMYSLLENRSKEIEIQKKYIQKLKAAIPPRKIAILFRIEKEFKEKIISNMKERRMQRKAGNE
jgi:hypothetical protein